MGQQGSNTNAPGKSEASPFWWAFYGVGGEKKPGKDNKVEQYEEVGHHRTVADGADQTVRAAAKVNDMGSDIVLCR